MYTPLTDTPEPIARNRRERRVAWLLLLLLVVMGWMVSHAVAPDNTATTPAASPARPQ